MNLSEQKKSDAATVRERSITIRLSDDDCRSIAKLCGEHGVSVSELLQNFICDLISGTWYQGTDESDIADSYFYRAYPGMYIQQTLLRYLLQSCSPFYGHNSVEYFIDCVDNIARIKHALEYYENNPSSSLEEAVDDVIDLHDDLQYYQEMYDYTLREYLAVYTDSNLEEQISYCRDWLRNLQQLLDEEV